MTEKAQELAEQLMSFIRESPILDQAHVEAIMVTELRNLGYTVTRNGAGGFEAVPAEPSAADAEAAREVFEEHSRVLDGADGWVPPNDPVRRDTRP